MLASLLLPFDEPLESFEVEGSRRTGSCGAFADLPVAGGAEGPGAGGNNDDDGAACAGPGNSVSEMSPRSPYRDRGLLFFLSRLGVLLLALRF